MIYADNAATTKLSETALEAMLPCYREYFGNPSSVCAAGQDAKRLLENARRQIAGCLGAEAREIIFTSGGSESDNQALRTAAAIGAASGKKHIISTAIEHHAILRTLDALQQEGFRITLLDVPESGILSAEQVDEAICSDTALVSVMYANNEIGTIQPVAEIGEICRQRGVLFHTDAVQAAGHVPIDVKAQQIGLLSLSAHKFHGPKGIGILYAKKEIRPARLICGGGQERGVRAGTENLPAIAGMAAALTESVRNMADDAAILTQRRDRLIAGLSRIPDSFLNGDPARRLPSNVNFSFDGIEGETLLILLSEAGICASSGSACASGSAEPSHVLRAIGRSTQLARGSLRLTIGTDITDDGIGYIIRTVTETVAGLRNAGRRPV